MNNVWNAELLGINISAISCWFSSICLPLSRVSVKTLIHCHECQKPLDITTLFLWSFPSSLTAFDPNSANLNTVPDRLHAGERRRVCRGKLWCQLLPPWMSHIPVTSCSFVDIMLWEVWSSNVSSLQRWMKWFLTDFSMDYCWKTASPLTHSQENKP